MTSRGEVVEGATTAAAAAMAVDVAPDVHIDSEQQRPDDVNDKRTHEAPSERTPTHAAAASETPLSGRKQRHNDIDASAPIAIAEHNDNNNNDDESSDHERHQCEFSAAQLRVKVQQARLEIKIAADEQALALRKQIIALEHTVQTLTRTNANASERHQQLQDGVDIIVAKHKRTLSGMRDDLELEALVAALETEKAAREALHTAFASQNAELLAARARVDSLNEQVRKYQKTETVLAQSVAHLQRRFESKSQQRVAALEHVKAELAAAHDRESQVLQHERDAAMRAEQLAIEQLQVAKSQLAAANAQIDAVTQLRDRNAELETDNAVLVRKAEQLQRADAQLRSRVKSHEDALAAERAQTKQLRDEVQELTKIASDLMEMAEKHQQEKRAGPPRDADAEFLATRKKRLRMSIG